MSSNQEKKPQTQVSLDLYAIGSQLDETPEADDRLPRETDTRQSSINLEDPIAQAHYYHRQYRRSQPTAAWDFSAPDTDLTETRASSPTLGCPVRTADRTRSFSSSPPALSRIEAYLREDEHPTGYLISRSREAVVHARRHPRQLRQRHPTREDASSLPSSWSVLDQSELSSRRRPRQSEARGPLPDSETRLQQRILESIDAEDLEDLDMQRLTLSPSTMSLSTEEDRAYVLSGERDSTTPVNRFHSGMETDSDGKPDP